MAIAVIMWKQFLGQSRNFLGRFLAASVFSWQEYILRGDTEWSNRNTLLCIPCILKTFSFKVEDVAASNSLLTNNLTIEFLCIIFHQEIWQHIAMRGIFQGMPSAGTGSVLLCTLLEIKMRLVEWVESFLTKLSSKLYY